MKNLILLNVEFNFFNLMQKDYESVEKPKKSRCGCPQVVDLVEDNMRSKLLFPLSALLLYVLIVVNIVGSAVVVMMYFL